MIRKAKRDDERAIFGLTKDFATSFKIEETTFGASFAALLCDSKTYFAVAEIGADVVGYVLAFRHNSLYANGPVVWIEEIMVDAEHRRQGIGRELMQSVDAKRGTLGRQSRLQTHRTGNAARRTILPGDRISGVRDLLQKNDVNRWRQNKAPQIPPRTEHFPACATDPHNKQNLMSHAPDLNNAQPPIFPDGKRVAVTLSFDDGRAADRKLVEIFNQLGLRATWNLNSGSLDTAGHLRKSELNALFANHEIAAHSVSHPRLDDLDEAQIVAELRDDVRALEDATGAPVRGLAYPYGNTSPRVIETIRPLGFAYARTCENNPNPFPWREPLAWPTTVYQNANDNWPVEFARRYEAGESFCFFVWGHAWEFEDDWARARRLYAPLANLADVCYATNIELWDWENARTELSLKEKAAAK